MWELYAAQKLYVYYSLGCFYFSSSGEKLLVPILSRHDRTNRLKYRQRNYALNFIQQKNKNRLEYTLNCVFVTVITSSRRSHPEKWTNSNIQAFQCFFFKISRNTPIAIIFVPLFLFQHSSYQNDWSRFVSLSNNSHRRYVNLRKGRLHCIPIWGKSRAFCLMHVRLLNDNERTIEIFSRFSAVVNFLFLHYRPQSEGYVFTRVCQSFCSQGRIWPITCWDTPPPPDQRQAPPGAETPPPPPSEADTPEAVHAGRYGQQEGGMHPTGM